MMSIEQTLLNRSNRQCELCGATETLSVMDVTPSNGTAEQSVLVCQTCEAQIATPNNMDANHWRCLNESMWSTEPAVQVLSFRLLTALRSEVWAQDLLEIMYLEDETRAWAEAGLFEEEEAVTPTKDSNGALLQEGDNVTLIKDLVVKGANFTAKRGTLVKNIHLTDNPLHIEGKVNGTQIVLVAAFLKKA